MRKLFLITLNIFLSALFAHAADLKLPSVIGSHMVLQQQSSPAIWGWAKAGETVSVLANWSDIAEITKANSDGKWKVNISTPDAGGPYEIIISSDTTYILKDILIGEVWVCSGQSNMEMPVKGYPSQPIIGSTDYIAKGNNYDIRLFTVKKKISIDPLDDCEGNWSVASPAEVANFSATGYFFGQYLQSILGVPVGLINTSWGGTRAEAWTDANTLKEKFDDPDLSKLATTKIHANSPTVLFNGMIHPILNFGIKGAIWYQGESNRGNPEKYSKLFPAMIQNWRERWDLGEFPFYFVQIAPYKYNEKVNSAFLREAQLKSMLTSPNTGMAVTMDIGNYDCIHPADKPSVGKRLAYWALAKDYGYEGIPYCGPVYKEMKVEGDEVTIVFDYAEIGLTSFDKAIEGLEVAGEDKEFFPATGKIVKGNLVVSSSVVQNPVAVRYCWKNFINGTLYNTAGLPASSFRTDDWEK